MTDSQTLSYEKAFERLELILSTLNEGKASLDESLHLFEEANSLITSCSKELSAAEKKIEVLIKGRNQELSLDANQVPKTQDFAPNSQSSLKESTKEFI